MSISQKAQLADEKLLNEAVKFGNIFKTMNECLWIGDKDHKTVYVNRMFEKLSGYSLKECVGKSCIEFFDQKGQDTIRQHHGLRRKGRSSQYEAYMLNKAGKKIPLLISGAPTASAGTMGIFTNLTELKKLERKERLAKQILQHSSEAVVILDAKRKVTLWSNGAKKLFGYKQEEMQGHSILKLIPVNLIKENRKIVKAVEEKEHLRNFETKRLDKNGGAIDVTISTTKAFDEENKFIGYLLIYGDITQKKRVNTELQKRFEAIQDAYKELGLKKRELDYIQEIASCGASGESLSSLANLIISAISLLTKSDGAVLRLYNEKTQSLKLQACLGLNHKWWDKSKISYTNSIAQEAFKTDRPLIIDDIDSYPKHQGQKLTKEHKFKTLILLPLRVNKRTIGTLSLYATDPAKFRLIETDFLENMAKQISLALYAKIPSA